MTQVFIAAWKLRSGVGDGEVDEVEVPVDSAICLLLLHYLHSTSAFGLGLRLVLQEQSDPPSPSLTVSLRGLQYSTVVWKDLPFPVCDCRMPVLSVDLSSCVAGLCAVLRQVVKHSGDEWRHLLGFREGCLFACAEVSLWTKFCEIDVIDLVNDVITGEKRHGEFLTVNEHMARFEEHLKQPVRMHNVDKLRKQIDREVDHDFAEGHSMSLADLVILPCVRVYLEAFGGEALSKTLPFVHRWFKLVTEQDFASDALSIIESVPSQIGGLTDVRYFLPEVARHSLYKSDPKRYKPKWKQYTRQEEVEEALRIVADSDADLPYDRVPFGHDVPLDWSEAPGAVQPDVPSDRLARKRQQLENLTKAIIKVAKRGDTVVDFCCGSGHLGITAAHWLPHCRVVLLDNKEQSLDRAKARVALLGLTNVTAIQCNLDYFKGQFQIGVSLHACGVASDLVIHTCLERNAAFIVCPCCYGSLQANHVVSYPQSAELSSLSPHLYLVLGHCADQTHGHRYSKSEQAERCMAAVDRDRCRLAENRGYVTSLAKLVPPSCTPKNNLIVGIPACS